MNKEEYTARIAGLFEKVKAETDTNDESVLLERYRDAEFDLTVEYRLGADFSPYRWRTLRQMHRQSQSSTEEIKEKRQSGELSKKEFTDQMQLSLDEMIRNFRSILTAEEHSNLFGSEEGSLGLAIDLDSL